MNEIVTTAIGFVAAATSAGRDRRVGAAGAPGLAVSAGVRPLRARRDPLADERDAMTRVFRTRSRGLVAEFG